MKYIMVPFYALCILSIYFLPTGVAGLKKQHNISSIFICNLFLGWTFLGWVIALIWAFENPNKIYEK